MVRSSRASGLPLGFKQLTQWLGRVPCTECLCHALSACAMSCAPPQSSERLRIIFAWLLSSDAMLVDVRSKVS